MATKQKMEGRAGGAPRARKGAVELLIGTTKGAFFLKSDADRKSWKLRGPAFLGHTVHHMVLDPRDRRSLLAATAPGHLGPTLHRSQDGGKSWTEAERPPAFPKAEEGEGRAVKHVFWLTPGHASEPGAWYAGTGPAGLFRSEDAGNTWTSVEGFNEHPMRASWTGGDEQSPPGNPNTHSILIDPRDPKHMYLGLSAGGVFESSDQGASWTPLNAGCAADFLPSPDVEFGHDPHCVRLHPADPDRLWQQNHCGIYRMDRGEGRWIRVGDNMPKKVGDIGFPMTVHPRDKDRAWVFPMDGTTVWPRTSPGGRPAVYATRDGGESWERQDRGLPEEQAWFTVKRQCMAQDGHERLGLYFGTTSGELWGSTNEGKSWKCLARHLPHVYSVEVAGHSQ